MSPQPGYDFPAMAARAIAVAAPSSAFTAWFSGSPSDAGPGWRSGRTSRGSSRGSGPARPSGSSASDGSAPLANLNEFFVHHEDVRRANGLGPRSLTPAMDAALWRNVRRGSHYLSRRLQACGLEIEWAGTDQRVTVRPGEPTAATQRCAGRTPAIRLWAPGCSAGRGERTTGGRCGGASHALRHVSPSLASIHRPRRYSLVLAGRVWV